jgi:hypothetical protein
MVFGPAKQLKHVILTRGTNRRLEMSICRELVLWQDSNDDTAAQAQNSRESYTLPF